MKHQIARRLTPDSKQVLNDWQQTFLRVKNLNDDPTIALVSHKLMLEHFLTKPKENVTIPTAVTEPITMHPTGLYVRRPLGTMAMISLMFEDAEAFIDQRRQLLGQNGAADKIGYYNPNLHVCSINNDILQLEYIAEAVNNRPQALTFAPAEVESF